jgi:hypothetical protein
MGKDEGGGGGGNCAEPDGTGGTIGGDKECEVRLHDKLGFEVTGGVGGTATVKCTGSGGKGPFLARSEGVRDTLDCDETGSAVATVNA